MNNKGKSVSSLSDTSTCEVEVDKINLGESLQPPMVTVITIVFNGKDALEKTIHSVINQKSQNYEFIIVDGGSSDGTLNLIIENEHLIDRWISEPDKGIYHAMNKGISLASGEYVIFMNSGDIFTDKNVLDEVEPLLDSNVDVVFSDWNYFGKNKLIRADKEKLNVRHQSVIYKKELHDVYGNYVVGKNITISDYLFFLSIEDLDWKYFSSPISICDEEGVSSKPSHFYQRILSECLYSKRSRLSASVILTLYPVYRFIKRRLFRVV